MPELSDLQNQFIGFLMGESELLKSSVADQGNISVETRLNIYRNAYQIRLTQVLETDHEMLGIYLGDELFDQMAAGFIDKHPSSFTSLRHFGEALPAFLNTTEPFSQHPVLSELALFERRLLDVFDAGNAERLPFSALQEIQPENWPDIRIRFHPGTQLLDARWNSVEIWKALKEKREPAEAINLESGYWLLWRGHDRLSEFRPLEEDEFNLLSLAVNGYSFSAMCESLLTRYREEQIGSITLQYLSGWFDQGLITALAVD